MIARVVVFLALFSADLPAAEPPEELMQRALVLDRQLRAREALALYGEIDRATPDNPTVLVGMARQYRHLMADASSDAEKRRLLDQALALSQRATELAPESPEAAVSVAITYGKMTLILGTKEKLAATAQMRAAAERTLRLDPQNDTAWHLLGRWHYGYAEVSGAKRALGEVIYGKIPTSTYLEAAKHFEKARALNPTRLIHTAELGRTYAAMARTAEARALLQQALAMPNREKDDPEAKKRARETLATLR